ncbi:MAG TPA: 50S ribosomal protein L25/general stress protein Ctc [Bacteroidales bacterium]|nr:50S ribosomal protein L25/general stress protein Ctc [Bacteroidales bacterium]
MKTVSVSGSLRENVGKKDAKSLRRNGFVPCVLYGGKEQLSFYVTEKAFKDVVYTPESCLISLNLSGKMFSAMLQDIQFHPVNENILHADFLEILDKKPVKIEIPVKLTGNSPGVIKGGKLQLKMRKLKVKALASGLPDFIEVPISSLDIGQSYRVGELSSDTLEFLDPKTSVIVVVKSTRVVATGSATVEQEEGGEA